MKKKFLFIFLILLSIGLSEVTLISPVQKTISNSIYLGKIAPSQELKLVFSREIGPGGKAKAIFWEKAVLPNSLFLNETLQGDTITAWIKMPEEIRGNYTFNVTLQGDILYLKPETKQITVDVTENVYNIKYETSFHSKTGKAIIVPVTITSESIADETLFLESTENFPMKWVNFPETTFNGKETKQIQLKLKPAQEGYYKIQLKIGRKSSNLINVMSFNLRTMPTIKSKLEAFGEGFSVTPIIMQPFYSFLSLLGYY